MTIDPGFIGKEARDAVGIQLLILVGAAAGIAFIIVGARTGAWWSGVPPGGFCLAGAAGFRLSIFGRRQLGRRVRETWGADGVAVRIGLRPHRPLALLCMVLSLVTMFGGCLLLVESAAGRVLLWVLLPLPLLLVPDCVRGLLARGREVVLTPRALTYRGFSYDVEVPWGEITRVDTDRSIPWVPGIRFDLRPGTTVRPARHNMMAWLDPPPGSGHVGISILAVDMPVQLIELARQLARMELADRSVHLARYGVATLTDEVRAV